MVMALRHPDLVRRLVVVDVAPVRYDRLTSFGRYVAGMRGLDLAATPDRASADAALRSARAGPRRAQLPAAEPAPRSDRTRLAVAAEPGAAGRASSPTSATGRTCTRDALPRARCSGSLAPIPTTSPRRTPRRCGALFPRVQLVTVKNSRPLGARGTAGDLRRGDPGVRASHLGHAGEYLQPNHAHPPERRANVLPPPLDVAPAAGDFSSCRCCWWRCWPSSP